MDHPTNGFNRKELLYEERFERNERQHQEIVLQLNRMERRLDKIDTKVTKHSAWWGAVGAGAVLAINFLAPFLFGGCG